MLIMYFVYLKLIIVVNHSTNYVSKKSSLLFVSNGDLTFQLNRNEDN